MSRALQVYYAAFDDVFLKLPEVVRNRIETEIDDMGRRLTTFPHYRMTGGHRFACASATTGSSMRSTPGKTKFISSPSATGAKSTGDCGWPPCPHARGNEPY